MRRTSVLAASLFVFSPLLVAQQAVQQPDPQLPATVLGPQLVVWSDLQKPRPVPEPLPPPKPDPPAQTQPPQSAGPQQPSSQAFAGTIVKSGSKYVLKVSDSVSYQIDDQEKAKVFEGKQVKVSGTLDAASNILHATSIELLP